MLLSIADCAHAWPGGLPQAGTGRRSRDMRVFIADENNAVAHIRNTDERGRYALGSRSGHSWD